MLIPAMADSITPALIPMQFTRPPDGVLVYADGQYAWPPAQTERFPRHISITVLGDPAAAHYARAIDVEHGDATVGDVPAFLTERQQLQPGDGTVYCDRSTVGQVLQVAPEPDYRFIVATLDGVYRTPEQLCEQLWQDYSVSLAPRRVWAIQWLRGTTYDQSAVFGPPDWDHNRPS